MDFCHELFTELDEMPEQIMKPGRKQIFLSYAREDVEAARKLYNVLSRLSKLVDIWFDEKCLQPGHNWKQEIAKAISRSDLFVALLSNNAVNKRGVVQKELRQAIEVMGTIPPDNIYLIPVRLDNCQSQHLPLSDIHRVDLFPDWDNGVEQLVLAIITHIYSFMPIPEAFSNIDICQVVKGAVDSVKDIKSGVNLNQHIDQCEVFGNTRELNQAILNLILNASDFGNTDYPIDVDVYKLGSSVFVKVTNIGKYIPKEDIYSGRIFKPFFSTQQKHKGLGLSVSNAIIEKHGGSIFVESVLIPTGKSTSQTEDQAITSFIMSINMVTRPQKQGTK